MVSVSVKMCKLSEFIVHKYSITVRFGCNFKIVNCLYRTVAVVSALLLNSWGNALFLYADGADASWA